MKKVFKSIKSFAIKIFNILSDKIRPKLKNPENTQTKPKQTKPKQTKSKNKEPIQPSIELKNKPKYGGFITPQADPKGYREARNKKLQNDRAKLMAIRAEILSNTKSMTK